MYKIIKDGVLVGITTAPTYIKMQENGCFGLCSREEAEGIAFDGKPYSLNGRMKMDGVEVASVEEDYDTTVSRDHTAAATVFVEQAEAGNIDENTALEHKGLFPEWNGDRVQVWDGTDGEHQQTWVRGLTSGLLYKCRKSHTTQSDWPPEITPALWAVISLGHAGTIDDPIPAERGMEYEYGKYYIDPENGKTYLCQRTGEAAGGTVVLHFLPHELVGNYFTLVE